MTLCPRLAFVFFALLPVACRAQRPEIASMPPDVRTGWDRCQAAVVTWCGDHSHHDPSEERTCVENASQEYARAADDAARAAYLQSHGCTP